MLGAQLLLFAGAQRGGGDLFRLVPEQRDAAGAVALVAGDGGDAAIERVQPPHHPGELAARLAEAGEAVEQGQGLPGAEQREVLALAVDVGEPGGEAAHGVERGGAVVDAQPPGDSAALGIEREPAAQQQFAVERHIDLLQGCSHGVARGAVAQVEDGFDFGALCAGADQCGVGGAAEREAQGFEEDALAGAGFARDHGEAGREVQLGLLRQYEIPQAQGAQHVAATPSPPRPAARWGSAPRRFLWYPTRVAMVSFGRRWVVRSGQVW